MWPPTLNHAELFDEVLSKVSDYWLQAADEQGRPVDVGHMRAKSWPVEERVSAVARDAARKLQDRLPARYGQAQVLVSVSEQNQGNFEVVAQ